MGIVSDVVTKLVPAWKYYSGLPLYNSIPLGLLVLLIMTVAYSQVWQVLYGRRKDRVPLVHYWIPWLGNAAEFGMNPYGFYQRCRDRHGDTFSFIMVGRTMTVSLGPKGHDLIFNAKDADVSAKAAYENMTTPVIGEGVVFDCPNHRLMEQKKFSKDALTRDSFRRYVPIIEKEVVDYINNNSAFKKFKVDVMNTQPEMTVYTASASLLGREVRNKFSKQTAQYYFDLDKGFSPLNFVLPNLPLPHNWRRDAARRAITSQYLEVIRQRRRDNDIHDRDLMGAIMASGVYRDGTRMTDENIASLCLGILLGGQHTSASTSAWMLLELGRNPEYQDKLYAELEHVLGRDTVTGELNLLTYDSLQEMPLVNATIRETIRLHAPLHSSLRKVMRPIPVPDTDAVIPAGHYLVASPGFCHISKDWFGDDADKFRPERWLQHEPPYRGIDVAKENSTVDYGFGAVSKGARSPYLPFGAGRHRCIGEHFAYCQFGTILVTFVSRMRWSLVPGESFPKPDFASMFAFPEANSCIIWEPRG